jgi:hypothetical protein
MKLKILIVFALSLGLTFLSQAYVRAADQPSGDNLHLYGLVQSINMQHSVVTINVKSENCSGERQFKFASNNGAAPFAVGQPISFVIDKSRCLTESMPSILKVIIHYGLQGGHPPLPRKIPDN